MLVTIWKVDSFMDIINCGRWTGGPVSEGPEERLWENIDEEKPGRLRRRTRQGNNNYKESNQKKERRQSLRRILSQIVVRKSQSDELQFRV